MSHTFVCVIKELLKLHGTVTKFREVSHAGQELQALSVALGEAEAAPALRFPSA